MWSLISGWAASGELDVSHLNSLDGRRFQSRSGGKARQVLEDIEVAKESSRLGVNQTEQPIDRGFPDSYCNFTSLGLNEGIALCVTA